MKKMLCVDGNSIINRAYYGIRNLTAHDGTPTNAIYGMINILSRHIAEIEPDYFVVAFDVHAPTFRHKMFSEYKAGRHATPPDLLAQFAPAKECLEAMGAHCVERTGYEADDILGTYSRICAENGIETYIVTGDKDSLQLIDDNTTVLLATTGESVRYDTAAFRARYGVDPSQFVDMKALMGDSSDNIPGAAGIGEVTAGKLIAEYGSIDALYEDLEEKKLSAVTKSKLIASKDMVYLSQKLARIDRNVQFLPLLERLAYTGPDRKALYALFRRLDFTLLIKRFGLEDESDDGKTPELPDVERVDASALKVGVKYGCAIDPDNDEIYLSGDGKLMVIDGIKENSELLCGGSDLICYDLKEYCHRLEKYGVDLSSCKDDVMLMAYVCVGGTSDISLGKLVSRYFCTEVVDSASEAYYVGELYKVFIDELEKTEQTKLYKNIELPLARVLYEMESDGFKVDTAQLAEFSKALGKAQDELSNEIYRLADEEFNINSPRQLGSVLFEKMKLPAGKKTKSGYSTSAEVLESLRPFSPIIDFILEYRVTGKLKSAYADGLVAAADKNGRVHTRFRQALTATGRLSSTEPNLQNIPIKTELGRQFRKFFIPTDENRVLIDADYSQIELRLLCALSGDENMHEAFLSGFDIHSSTAMKIFGVPEDEVTIEMRKKAKVINFGIMYGMGEFSLAEDMHTTRKQAAEYMKSYLQSYPKVKKYLSDVVEQAKKDGYVTTLFGRRRYIPELASHRRNEVAFGERVAMNSPIQGTAADIIKLAMVAVDKRLKEEKLDARLLLQVHDELIVEASKSCADKAAEILKYEMEHAVELSVPLTVEIAQGQNWYEAH